MVTNLGSVAIKLGNFITNLPNHGAEQANLVTKLGNFITKLANHNTKHGNFMT